jgi:DAACS family dicarboxylate/amino acid:cation (Na+ or H+) symporter
MGDLRSLGRAGWRTLFLTLALSATAVALGLLLVNGMRPGDGVDPLLAQRLLRESAGGAKAILERSPSSLDGPTAFVEIVGQRTWALRAAAIEISQTLGGTHA